MGNVFLRQLNDLTRDEKMYLVEMYGNAILEDYRTLCCLNCGHYDFEDDDQQICNNVNNHQLNDDNEANEKKYYKMMVTPDFCCNEWKEVK